MLTFIYTLRDPDTGSVRYVGKSDNPKNRLCSHLCEAPHRRNHREKWVASLLDRGMSPVLVVEDTVLEIEWQAAEAAYISFFRELGADLVNGTLGGDGGPDNTGRKHRPEVGERRGENMRGDKHPMFGKAHSKEAREKISAAGRGRVWTDEARRNHSAAMKRKRPHNFGKKLSPEQRKKLSEAHRGKTISAEHRAALSASLRGRVRSPEHCAALSESKARWWAARKAAA